MIFTTQDFIAMQIITPVDSLYSDFHLFLGLTRCQLMKDLLYIYGKPNLIAHKVFSKVFRKSLFPHKSVKFFFILVTVKDKLTDLWGNRLLHNFFKNTVREIKSFWDRARPLRRTREALRAAGRTQGTAPDLRQKSRYESTFNPKVNIRVNFRSSQRMISGVWNGASSGAGSKSLENLITS